MAEENQTEEFLLLNAFMSAGKITVFESGDERPDHLQNRPFIALLPKGKTTFIHKGDAENTLSVKSAEEQAESLALDTEAHTFFETLEKRFRNVMPGVTIFIIDPDAVQGRYLMDHDADRSLEKSLYLFVEEKLQKAAAGNDKTFLTQEEILKSVSEAGITDRNPFSMRAAIGPTLENLAGLGNVNLVVGDNPDAMEANVLGMVLGSEERRVKEGISYDEFRRLVLYHELGHATDNNYASALNSIEKIAENDLDNVMNRHRTECIADAHAVLQLARDFGNTKCAELWGDCRIEYLRICVDRRLDDTKYDTDFIKKLREAEEKSHALNPDDPNYENDFKKLMADKQVADTISKLGTPLAYHTTDVIDATVKWAQEHLADGSLQKMSDLEVIKQAQIMAETYGLTRQQMAEMSIALAKGETHPKYEQMMERVQVSRDHMPIDNKKLEKEYELQRELNAYIEAVQLATGLGLPPPEQNFSPALKKKLKKEQIDAKKMEQLGQLSIDQYQQELLDKLENVSSREEMHAILGQEKEALRKAGKTDKGNKDLFAGSKLKVVDAVIEQAPNVEMLLAANNSVKKQLDKIRVKSKTKVSGDEAIVHFIKSELSAAAAMGNVLSKAVNRPSGESSVDEQLDAMVSEKKDFKKALIAEAESQIAAFAIRSDKEAWAKVSQDPVLAELIEQKAKQKPNAVLGLYQLNMKTMDQNTAVSLFQSVAETHKYLVETFTGNPQTAKALKAKDTRIFETMKKYADKLKASDRASPLNLKNFTVEATKQIVNAKKAR
ncbi:MAG: hypothetical protein J5787_06155 [Alphaproteobacteria bacterium]|nr:hypothetical protein [Alphaproteobacteria bacterium]